MKLHVRILTLLLVAVVVLACESGKKKPVEKHTLPRKSPEQYKREFRTALQKGDTIEAIKALERFQKVDRKDLLIPALKAWLEAETGKLTREEGIERLRRFYEKSPTEEMELLYVSFAIYKAKPEIVMAAVDTMIIKYPDERVFHLRRAYATMDLGRYDESIESFTTLIKMEPDNLYHRADRTLASYKKGEKKMACMAWKAPGGGAQEYFEQYCKWPQFEETWNAFIKNTGSETAREIKVLLSQHYESMAPPDEKLSAHLLDSWTKLSRKTPGNETLLDIGFDLLKLLKDDKNFLLRCELAKSITIAPEIFLAEVSQNRHRLGEDLNGLVGAFGKELINDKATQLKEVEKRIMAFNSVNDTNLIKTRGQCLLALEKKRERLMQP